MRCAFFYLFIVVVVDICVLPFPRGLSQIRHRRGLQFTARPQSVIFHHALLLPDPYHGTPIDCSVTCNILINYPHGSALNLYNLVHLIFQY